MESEQPLRHESQANPKDRFGSVSSIPRCQRLVRLPLNSCRFGAVRRNDEMCHFRTLVSARQRGFAHHWTVVY
jgi:hypothetical protein